MMKWIVPVLLLSVAFIFGQEPVAAATDAGADTEALTKERDALRAEVAQSKLQIEQLQQEAKYGRGRRGGDEEDDLSASTEKTWLVKVISNDLRDAAEVKLQLQERKSRLKAV